MKALASLLVVGALFSAGCAGRFASDAANGDESGLKPGMTRKQVVARLGETNHRRATGSGESWVYNLDDGQGFVPWNHGYRARFRIVDFDGEGQVIGWRVSDSNSSFVTNSVPGN